METNINDLMARLPNRITKKENSTIHKHYILKITKALLVDNKDKLKTVYIANYVCDSTDTEGPESWLDRKLFHYPPQDESFTETINKLLIALKEYNYI